MAPLVVFVNSRSGGRHGPELKVRLHELITEEQVGDGIAIRSARVQLCFPNFASGSSLQRSGLILQLASDCFYELCVELAAKFEPHRHT